jgi:hypothetical protein
MLGQEDQERFALLPALIRIDDLYLSSLRLPVPGHALEDPRMQTGIRIHGHRCADPKQSMEAQSPSQLVDREVHHRLMGHPCLPQNGPNSLAGNPWFVAGYDASSEPAHFFPTLKTASLWDRSDWGPPAHWHVFSDLACQVDLPKLGDEDRNSAEGRPCSPGFSQGRPLVRLQRLDCCRDFLVPLDWLHPSVAADSLAADELSASEFRVNACLRRLPEESDENRSHAAGRT